MSRRDVRARPAWRVRIPAHTIQALTVGGDPIRGKVYEIAAVDTMRFEEARETAVGFAVTWAHRGAGVPPRRRYRAESVALARVERVTWHPETASAG